VPWVTAAHTTPGLVQGVGFRYSTVQEAKVRFTLALICALLMLSSSQRLKLRGWVRNTRDGAVEGEAAGPASELQEL